MTPRRLRNRHLIATDAALIAVASLSAFAVRFESIEWIGQNLALVLPYLALTVPSRLAVFYLFGLYRRLWRHASVGELKRILAAAAVSAACVAIIGLILLPWFHLAPTRAPFSVVFIDGMLTAAAIGLPRVLARIGLRSSLRISHRRRRDDQGKGVLIVGAGTSGKMVAKELFASPSLGFDPVGFVDDDVSKHKHMLCDLPVIGPISDLKRIVEHHGIAEIIIAMPSAPGSVIRRVVRAALDAGIPTLTVPSLPEMMFRRGGGSGLREVQIEDLLRRDPIDTDLAAVAALATGETVLVTGAGGSIGSELCRQLARLAPANLVLLGHGENSIFDIHQELVVAYPDLSITPVIADVRDRRRIAGIFSTFRPHAVFHAAAHKHVPLMEDNVVEAVSNNVGGTYNVVQAAMDSGVQHFVLISTDKAVRPTSVMGATKRVAEQIVQNAAVDCGRNFGAVRFGNVLGSRGSVVPTFLRQIRAGGPVTITHPEMQRYFMTIPEAVQLVLQAGALGQGGEVFVLDMGEPVRIVDLATDLIRLTGLEVDKDIRINFTGVRPGEKLYEEMFFSAESVIPTHHSKVLKARDSVVPVGLLPRIEKIIDLAERPASNDEIRRSLKQLVPDFHIHGPHHDTENGETAVMLRFPAAAPGKA
ncbi:MAG TPA: nucleoside-diphosphate sugar epimerase/dehydratase [Gemmatimonadaceae bacterium]